MAAPERSILEIMREAGQEPPRVQLPPAVGDGDGDGNGRSVGRAGRYEVIGPLAEGGVGEVLRGRDLDLGRDVALKVLREKHRANPELVQRLLDEAQIGGQLQHPGIVPVYEIGVDDAERPFVAMKLVKGRTLAARLADRSVPDDDRRRFLRLFEQLAQAVAYAHARGVVHRDLKPSNVMVGTFGEVQVLDWGFAKVLRRGGLADEHREDTREADLTRIATVRSSEGGSVAGSVMGTPAYMPPEQALGEIDHLDERCDVFALGAILCEILTGKPPYVGDREDLLTLAAQARLDDADARLDACDADASLVALCRSCLEPLRGDRPRDASVVADAVHDHLASVEERARTARIAAAEARAASEKAEAEADRQRRSRRQSVWLGVCVLALLVASIGGAWGIRADARAQAERTATAVMAALQDAEQLRGEGRLKEAEVAAERASGLGADGDVPRDLQATAGALLAAVSREREERAAQRAQQAKDEVMVSRLEEIAWGALVVDRASPEYRRGEQALKEAFQTYGLDVEASEPDVVADAVARSAIHDELLRGLEHWLFLRKSRSGARTAKWEHLAAVVQAVDPDSWSERVRSAALANDPEVLRKAALDDAGLAARPERAVTLTRWLAGAGESDVALSLLESHLVTHPDDVMAHEWARIVALQLGRNGAVRRHAMACLALRPSSARALRTLSGACLLLDDPEGALGFAERCLAAAPESVYHVSWIVSLHQGQGTLDAAVEAWRAEAERAPDSPQPHALLAAGLVGQGDLADAQRIVERWIARRPKSAWAAASLAGIHYRMGRTTEAAEAMAAAVTLEPTNPDWPRWLGGLLALGQGAVVSAREEAVRQLERLLPDATRGTCYYVLLGYAEQATGIRIEDALASLREAAELAPHDPEPQRLIAELLGRHTQRNEDAYRAAERAVELDPWSARPRLLLSTAAYRLGRRDEALEQIREAARRQAPNGEAGSVWTWLLAFHELGDEAVTYYRDRVEQHPTWSDRRSLGYALLRMGRHDEAAEVLGDLWREASTWGGVALGYGVALWRSGRPDETEAVYREFVRRHPRLGQRSVVPLLCDLYLRTGRPEQARDLELEALRLQPGNGYLERNVAYTAAWTGEAEAARRWCLANLPNPRSPRSSTHVACGIGEALLARGDLPQAVVWLERALDEYPHYPMIQEYLAIALVARGDRERAEAVLRALKGQGAVPVSAMEAVLAWEAGRFDDVPEAFESQRRALVNQAFRGSSLNDEVEDNRNLDVLYERLAAWARRLASLQEHVEAIRSGSFEASSVRDALDVGEVARCVGAHRAAAQYYRQAFDSYLREFRWDGLRVRFRAARAAVCAAAEAEDETRADLHAWARERLREELEEWRIRLADRPAFGRRYPYLPDAQLWHWKYHVDLASVRDAEALAELPDDERAAWEAFWRDVDEVLEGAKR